MIGMELIPAKKQSEWGWPAIANFVLGGMTAGYYLLSLLAAILLQRLQGASQPDSFKLIAPLLVAAGFLALTVEAGRPLRGVYLLNRLNHSWMSRETLAGGIFVGAALLERSFSHPALLALSALSAAGLLGSQAFVLMRARAVTAWDVPLFPLVIASSGLAAGSGLILLTPAAAAAGRTAVVLALFFGMLDLAVWHRYLHQPGSSSFLRATAPLRRTGSLLSIMGIGRLLPALLLSAALLPWLSGGSRQAAVLLAGAGLVAGGAMQKVALLRKTAHLRSIEARFYGRDEPGVLPTCSRERKDSSS